MGARKIADAEMARRLGQASVTDTDSRVPALALAHHLVSRLTSLVAVDATPSRPTGARLARAELPLNLPAGWEFEKVFGEHAPAGRKSPEQAPDRATPVPLERRAGAVPPAAVAMAAVSGPGGVALPRTGTDAELNLMIGIVLLVSLASPRDTPLSPPTHGSLRRWR